MEREPFARIHRTPMSELTVKPAVELIGMLQRGTLSALELAQEHLREIERLNPLLRAFVDVDPSEVLKAAAEADKLRTRLPQAEDASPLLGLPCSIKSSISVAGHLCETGTKLNRGFRPEFDAAAVRLLRQAGAVILGTTNCPEFLMAYETDNLLYGATSNPWSLQHQAGGSSGGESAAIAAGLSAGGIGSDSGGSVREPAHFTGICSLKPTPGRISTEGHTLPCVGPFATLGALGPMARTIADVSLLFESVSSSKGVKMRTPEEHLRKLPIGVLEDDGHIPVTQETRAAVRAAAQALKERGFELVPFVSKHLEPARKLWQDFFIRCGRTLLEPVIQGHEDQLSATFNYFLNFARCQPQITAAELLATWAEAAQLRETLTHELAMYTAVITPVAAIPAFRHGERRWLIEGRPLEYFDAMRFTQWFNLLGAPAAVVPVGLSSEGLPIGVQVASYPHADEIVLAVADLIDKDFGYRPPPMAYC